MDNLVGIRGTKEDSNVPRGGGRGKEERWSDVCWIYSYRLTRYRIGTGTSLKAAIRHCTSREVQIHPVEPLLCVSVDECIVDRKGGVCGQTYSTPGDLQQKSKRYEE